MHVKITIKKPPQQINVMKALSIKLAPTYFPTLKGAVSSALKGLTTLFGMGRGGTLSL
jgi:hypothetical protein